MGAIGSRSDADVVVIGAGIAGLCAAHRLAEFACGAKNLRVESSRFAVNMCRIHRRESERMRLAEIAEGEHAKEQVMLAMRIASAKLNAAQKKIRETAGHKGGSK